MLYLQGRYLLGRGRIKKAKRLFWKCRNLSGKYGTELVHGVASMHLALLSNRPQIRKQHSEEAMEALEKSGAVFLVNWGKWCLELIKEFKRYSSTGADKRDINISNTLDSSMASNSTPINKSRKVGVAGVSSADAP